MCAYIYIYIYIYLFIFIGAVSICVGVYVCVYVYMYVYMCSSHTRHTTSQTTRKLRHDHCNPGLKVDSTVFRQCSGIAVGLLVCEVRVYDSPGSHRGS